VQTKAVVVREVGSLSVETISLDPPKSTEILVRMHAAGVCHSDLHTLRGELRAQPPLVIGHEGSGIVEQVGADVKRIKPGDRILVNWIPACRNCGPCLQGYPNQCERLADTTLKGYLPDGTSRLRTLDGIQLKHYLSSATMAEYIVIDEASAVVVPEDVPFEIAAIVGCAVVTGFGAVVNTAQIKPGSSAAVIGCGGVGLSMLLGCKLAGCNPLVAVDVVPAKLDLARKMGATEIINASQGDVVDRLKMIPGKGPSYVFDSVGSVITVPQAIMAARPRGTIVVAGMYAAKIEISIPIGPLIFQEKKLMGSFVGSSNPLIDLPKIIELYRDGLLDLDPLVSQRYPLADAQRAFNDLEAGQAGRGVIMFP